jgi:hypothetical protein
MKSWSRNGFAVCRGRAVGKRWRWLVVLWRLNGAGMIALGILGDRWRMTDG